MFLKGKIGDFVIHAKTLKLAQGWSVIQIAYVGQKLGDAKIGKILVNKSKIGDKRKYSIENSNWFDFVSELIDNVGDAYCQWLSNPFFGIERIIINKDTNAMLERQENMLSKLCVFSMAEYHLCTFTFHDRNRVKWLCFYRVRYKNALYVLSQINN